MRNFLLSSFLLFVAPVGIVQAAFGPPTLLTFNAITSATMNGSFKANPNSDGYLVLRKIDSSPQEVPLDGSVYSGFFGTSVVVASSSAITFSSVGLAAGTVYYYAIYSYRGSGTLIKYYAASSLNKSQITVPEAPITNAGMSTLQNSFVASWQAAIGASSYHLDISTDDFANFLSGYDAKVVSLPDTSITVSGITSGTLYKYRVRALNAAGESNNSNVMAQITIPSNPIANSVVTKSANSFFASWEPVVGASSYELDVSLLSSNFIPSILGYEAKFITGATTEVLVAGLSPGSYYTFRVRAVNGGGSSGNSNSRSLITDGLAVVFGSPTALTFNTISTTSMNGSFYANSGADGYLVLRKIDSSPQEVPLDGSVYSGFFGTSDVVSNGTGTAFSSLDLIPGTLYYYTIYSYQGIGVSIKYFITMPLTNSQVTLPEIVLPFSVTISTFTNTQFTGADVVVDGQILNAKSLVTAKLIYKGITETETKEKPINYEGTQYSTTINDAMLDELGVEYFVSVKDSRDSIRNSETKILYRSFTSANSPTFLNGNFEGTMASIRIISIPMDPSDNLIQSIFYSLGTYDKKGWRLAHYQDGQNVEYNSGINKMERGNGYWFNAKGKSVSIKTGEGTVGKYDQKNPFKLSLLKGWNQIGNPFPFDINWQDVLADNSGVTGVGSLMVYNGLIQNYTAGNSMKANTGGFVFSDKVVTINIGVSLKSRAAGRQGNFKEDLDISQSSWRVPFTVTQQNVIYNLGGVGMQAEASAEKDQWDEIRLPRLDEFLDVTFYHPENEFSYFTKDIVPTSNEHTWKYFIESSHPDEHGLLEWNNEVFGNNGSQLFLLDVELGQFIDMRKRTSYSFTNPGKKEFRMYYRNDDRPVIPDILIVGDPYPNPSTASIYATVLLPESSSQMNVVVTAVNLFGQEVNSLLNADLGGGIYYISWDGNDSLGSRVSSGIYIIRTRINGRSISQVHKVFIK
ncbi:MAG: fibronectin type III domain-containing protein [Bacteroidia bacterium]|nr:fibronectin type III domain-containing protein [Bacteroidia bacterium]